MQTTRFLLLSLAITALAPFCFAEEPIILQHSIPAPIANLQSGAQLGWSVALDEPYAVVAAPYEDVSAVDEGVVKVFDSTTGALKYRIPNPEPGTVLFGNEVAISGSRMVVRGGDGESLYVYKLANGNPTVPVAKLRVEGVQRLAISGNRLIVGSTKPPPPVRPPVRRVDVYDLDSATPAVPALTLHNPSPGGPALFDDDHFGGWIAASGSRVVVSATGEYTAGNNARGVAYVYDLESQTPAIPMFILRNPDAASNLEWGFGDPVAISGSLVLVGGLRNAFLYDLASATPTVGAALPEPADAGYPSARALAVSGLRALMSGWSSTSSHVYVYDLPTRIPALTLTYPLGSAGNFAMAISGTRVLAGVHEGDLGARDTGAAYLFDLASATPTAATPVENKPGPAVGDLFGFAVAVSGTRVVVGARLDDDDARLDDYSPGADAGSAYVYDLNGSTPSVPVVALHNPDSSDYEFGNAVAISGTRIVVGAWKAALGTGKAYVYDLASATPTVPTRSLNRSGAATNVGDLFGASVAISGSHAVVGAPSNDTGGVDAGRVYAYDVVNGGSAPVAILANPVPAMAGKFGTSVAISGARVVVGTPADSTAAVGGSAYVYDLAGPTPATHVTILNNPNPSPQDSFGNAVAISGTRVVVGAWKDDTGASDAGSAYVYDLAGATPAVPTLILNNPHPRADASFGVSVAISGTRIVVGSAWDSTGAFWAGSAYVYDLTSATPTVPVATLQKPAPGAIDTFGYATAIDGTTIAIGAPADDTVARDKGSVYVYGPAAPEIAVQFEPGANALSDGGSQSVGSVFVNGEATFHFTIRNPGSLPLTGLATSIDGANASEFTVSSNPAGPVTGPGGATSFTVRFAPSGLGARAATLHIASNDADESPFDINLTGTGIALVNHFESWALIHGLSGADAGPSADPDHDARTNWDEFCFGTSPMDGKESSMRAIVAGAVLTLTWLEREGVVYRLAETPDLILPWAANPHIPTLSADQSGVPAGYQRKEIEIPVPPSAVPATNRFFRVEASTAP